MTPDLTIVLPFPPSVNHFWQHTVKGKYVRTYVSAAGREFKRKVARALNIQLGSQRETIMAIAVSMWACTPPTGAAAM